MAIKKVFVCSANNEDDLNLVELLMMHVGLSKKIRFWHYSLTTAGEEIEKKNALQLNEADVFVPILTINYFNNEQCMLRFKKAVEMNKVIMPLFAKSFDIDAVEELKAFRNNILLDDKEPLDIKKNIHEALADVSELLRERLLGENRKKTSFPKQDSKKYNYILAIIPIILAIVFLISAIILKVSIEIIFIGTFFLLIIALLPYLKILSHTNIINEN